ncbi:MAG: VCBS repeat-containing protein, partial [Flavobacteriales bacterium]|nr:VCBS repeat-containing protein [Flavobacteriales bacterium]
MKTLFQVFTFGLIILSVEGYTQSFNTQNIIESNFGVMPIEVFWADFNSDGFEDALLGSTNNKVVWYANDGMGGFGSPQVVVTTPWTVTAAKAADLNGDGFPDIYCSTQDDQNTLFGNVLWFANDGTGNFGPPQGIGLLVSGPQSLDSADMDGDGDIDVVVAIGFENEVSWFENNNASFSTEHVIQNVLAPAQIFVSDIDGDGDNDVLSHSIGTNEVNYIENAGGGTFNAPQVVVSQSGTVRLFTSDMDGDGLLDIVTSSTMNDNISWWKNDGSNNFTTQNFVYSIPGFQPTAIFCSDIDLDGDQDIVWGEITTSNLFWQANNGTGSFSLPNIISNASDSTISIYVSDIDGDNDMDVLGGSVDDNKIAWYENTTTISGCTSLTACNYNSSATFDDGTCIEPTGCQTCSGQTAGTGVVVHNDND